MTGRLAGALPHERVTINGRELAVDRWGAPDGHSVFLMHGMPGSRVGPRPRGVVLHRLGVQLVSYDRPGYGRSTRQPGRTVADAAADVVAIADHLGLDTFSVVGRSGGAPHALACAALAPDRVRAAAALVSVAPADADGLDWHEGMAGSNVETYRRMDRALAQERDAALLAEGLESRAAGVRDDPESLIRLLQPDLVSADRRVVEDRVMRDLLTATYAEAVRAGSGGWVDDAAAFRRPWGFKLSAVECPVLLWHGGADRFSPVAHTRWLYERLCETRYDPGSVCLSIDDAASHFGAFEVMPAVLAWLRDVRPGNTPRHAGPRHAESRHVEPHRVEPHYVEPHHVETHHADVRHPEPFRSAMHQSAAHQLASHQPASHQPAARRAEPRPDPVTPAADPVLGGPVRHS